MENDGQHDATISARQNVSLNHQGVYIGIEKALLQSWVCRRWAWAWLAKICIFFFPRMFLEDRTVQAFRLFGESLLLSKVSARASRVKGSDWATLNCISKPFDSRYKVQWGLSDMFKSTSVHSGIGQCHLQRLQCRTCQRSHNLEDWNCELVRIWGGVCALRPNLFSVIGSIYYVYTMPSITTLRLATLRATSQPKSSYILHVWDVHACHPLCCCVI